VQVWHVSWVVLALFTLASINTWLLHAACTALHRAINDMQSCLYGAAATGSQESHCSLL
jgi:hypothetical protein